MDEIERRVVPMELRVERREGNKPTVVGHAAVFNQLSEDLGGFREMVLPGCFTQTIATDDIRGLFNHSPNMILGRNRAGTLVLREDNQGLYYEIPLPDTQAGRDVAASIERGDITGNSFSFRTIEDEWLTSDGMELRRLKAVRLFDVGPVTYPAYPQTDLAMRSLENWRKENGGTHRRDVRERMQDLAELDSR